MVAQGISANTLGNQWHCIRYDKYTFISWCIQFSRKRRVTIILLQKQASSFGLYTGAVSIPKSKFQNLFSSKSTASCENEKNNAFFFLYSIDRFHKDVPNGVAPYFVFGDFNFRCDTEGVVKVHKCSISSKWRKFLQFMQLFFSLFVSPIFVTETIRRLDNSPNFEC